MTAKFLMAEAGSHGLLYVYLRQRYGYTKRFTHEPWEGDHRGWFALEFHA